MSVKQKLDTAGRAIAEAADEVGQKVGEQAGKAVDFAKEKAGLGTSQCQGLGDIREHMAVYSNDGSKVGVVDRFAGETIKLTRSDSPDGQHHFIPASWVERVDSTVHLSKSRTECMTAMTGGSCGC